MQSMSTFGQAMDAASINDTRESIRVMKEYAVVWFTILVWDTLATLPNEWRYIHRAKWTPLKVMFLVNRYYTIAAQASTVFLLLAPLSPDTCRKIFWGFATDGIAVMFFCDCIIAIRVYAVYEKSRRISYLLIGMLAADLGLMTGAATQLRPVIYSPELRAALQFEGCAAAIPNGRYTWLISVIYWSPPLVFNAISLALIFRRNLELARQAGRIPILQRMLKDGLFFFSVIMAANLVNVILVVSQTSPALKNFNIPASLTLTSLMCSRLVLSLHQHNADIRKSQAGNGASIDHIVSGSYGGPPTTRASQMSCHSRTQRQVRSRIEECAEEEEEEDDPDPNASASATAHEVGSSETVDDKLQCMFRREEREDPTATTNQVTSQVNSASFVPSIALDASMLSPPATPDLDQTSSSSPSASFRRVLTPSEPPRRDSVISFSIPGEIV